MMQVEALGQFPLSVVVSFLREREGVSFLITNKRLASQFLPVYRIQGKDVDLTAPKNQRRNQYRFAVLPVQDAAILLERLNTRRLFQRGCRQLPVGLTTKELARREWTLQKQVAAPDATIKAETCYPPELELLRFPSSIHDPEMSVRDKTLLVSYPRSGNTLARHLLERVTGVVTGSDTHPTRILSQQLKERHGLMGEGLIRGVSVVKSHWPERKGYGSMKASRGVILLVRNPFDAIDSYWNLNATLSHTARLTDAVYEQYAEKFDGLVRNEIHTWHAFLKYWLVDVQSTATVPICVVRYEDLIREPFEQVCRMTQCVLGVESLPIFWRDRVKHGVSTMDTCRSGSIGKSLRRYSTEQLDYMHRVSLTDPHHFMRRFGYCIVEQDFPNNFSGQPTEPPTSDVWESKIGALKRTPAIAINTGLSIRPESCLYGRALQKWRHSVTNTDQNPLPTI